MPGKAADTKSGPVTSKSSKYGLAASTREMGIDMWGVDGEVLRDAVANVVTEGDAILFGMTRDLSACKIQILTNGGSEEFYAGSTGSFEDALRLVRDASKIA